MIPTPNGGQLDPDDLERLCKYAVLYAGWGGVVERVRAALTPPEPVTDSDRWTRIELKEPVMVVECPECGALVRLVEQWRHKRSHATTIGAEPPPEPVTVTLNRLRRLTAADSGYHADDRIRAALRDATKGQQP